MNNTVATTGLVRNLDTLLCRAASSHSRIPGGSSRPAAGNARNARPTGPPNTSRIGTSIDSSM